MKIVHAADLHIDSPLRGLERYAGAPVDRVRAATREAFGRVVELCQRERARFLILAGDVFDGDWKDMNTGIWFAGRLRELRDVGCDVLLLRGNHDHELTRALRHPPHVHEFSIPSDPAGRTFVFEHEGVAFHGASYPARDVRTTLLPYYPRPIAGLLNVGVLHTNATGSADHDPYAPCTVSELVAYGYGYWALGHVHAHSILARPGEPRGESWVVYPGNTQGRSVRETGPKGCVLLDVEQGTQGGGVVRSVDFVETAVMTFRREEIVLAREDDVDDLRDRVRARIDDLAEEPRPSAVRLTVRGACRAHAAICRERAKIVGQLRDDVLDRGGPVWLEKVELATSPETPIEKLREARGLVADLLRHVDRVRDDEGDAELLHLGRVLEGVGKKLGRELDELGALGIRFDDPEFLRRVLDQAEALLAQKLTDGELASSEPRGARSEDRS